MTNYHPFRGSLLSTVATFVVMLLCMVGATPIATKKGGAGENITTGSSSRSSITGSLRGPTSKQFSSKASVIKLDQTCFERHEEIVVQFDNSLLEVDEHDWIGIYPDDFHTTEEPITWLYTCGTDSLADCPTASNNTSSTGTSTAIRSLSLAGPHQLEPGHYVAVVAHEVPTDDKDSYHIKATSDNFVVVRNTCSIDIENTTTTQRQLQSQSMATMIQNARDDIFELFRSDISMPARCLRMVFHDCIGGRCDGCVNMENVEHRAVDVPMNALRDIGSRHRLTRADLWVLAGFCAVEFWMPPDNAIQFRFEHWGRRDCDAPMTAGPNPIMCHADFGTDSMLNFMQDQFGYSPSEVAAIMGAHTIGVMRRDVLGYEAPNGWVTDNQRFDNQYHQELIGRNGDLRLAPNWNQDLVRNGDSFLPDRWQWEGFPGGRQVTMLNSDIALVRDLSSSNRDREGRVSCGFIGRGNMDVVCPPAPSSLMEPMIRYASDNIVFLRDFYRALVKMTDVGYRVDDSTCDSNNVCQLR